MKSTRKLVLAGLFLALAFILPFLTGQIPQIGSLISPMHIPVFICGLVCGPVYGLVVGLVAPLLRSVILGMPPLFPVATAMAFELAAYGLISGLIYSKLPRKTSSIYIALIAAMLVGRIIWGIAMYVLLGIAGNQFTMQAFLAGAFINAVVAIVIHLLIVPVVVKLIEGAGLGLHDRA